MHKKLLLLNEYLTGANFTKEAQEVLSLISETNFESPVEKIKEGLLTIASGDKDDLTEGAVSEIQRLLEGHNYMLDQFGVDGIFGPETESKVLEFQENNGLSPTGIVGKDTLIKLESSSAIAGAVASSGVFSKLWSWIRGDDEDAGINQDEYSEGQQVSVKSGRVSESQLYNDLISSLGNANLCIAMVANAIAESGLRPGIAGDCGDYADRHSEESINTLEKGRCCSFGLWQYNICGGMGVGFLEANGNPSDEEEKARILSDYNLQVDYMVGKLKSRYSSEIIKEKSVDDWVDWFVRTIERPANADRSVAKRQNIARGLGSLSRVV